MDQGMAIWNEDASWSREPVAALVRDVTVHRGLLESRPRVLKSSSLEQATMSRPQNFENHVRVIPGYHMVTFGIFAINLVWCIYRAVRAFSVQSVISLLLAVGFLLLFFYARIFVLTVQDRVVRLEMRLRLQQALPADLLHRIPEFEVGQLVALRFASDQELPSLARRVLDENLRDRKTIKKMIRAWQPDS